jgi:hypothetical protein
MEEAIHSILEEFPQHADCHGKAESDDAHIQRRQAKFLLLIAAENIHQ